MNQQELFVFMVMSAWDSHVKRTDLLFDSLTDEQMMQPVAPGKNRVVYLAGHLAAVNDGMIKILGMGERLYPQLDDAFITNPDSVAVDSFPITTVRKAWNETHQKLTECFNKMKPEEWSMRHNSVSAEDFEKEPHRNKLNVLISRTNHLAYHLGQVMLVKK